MLCAVAAEDSDDVVKKFNPAHPEGSYTLSMTVPAQRTIAALLCSLDLDHKEDMIVNIRLDGTSLESNVKKLKWPAKYATNLLLLCMQASYNFNVVTCTSTFCA